MKYVVISVALLLSCSTSAPTEYRQAPYVPPAVRPPPSGAGAPVLGQPGSFGGDHVVLPRSPNRRPLPPSSEPGLWASDGSSDTKIILGNIEIPPLPEDATEVEKHIFDECVAGTRNYLDHTAGRKDPRKTEAVLRSLPFRQAQCAISRIYLRCVDTVESKLSKVLADMPKEVQRQLYLGRLLAHARSFMDAACYEFKPRLPEPGEMIVDNAIDKMREILERLTREMGL